MSGYRDDDDEPEEEEEDDESNDVEETKWLNKDSILFVIDCTKDMLEPSIPGENSPLVSSLRGASRVLQNKIIGGVDDLVGVLFYGSAKSKNEHNHDNIYVLQELNVPDAPGVAQLESLLDPDKFKSLIGHADQAPTLDKVLWAGSMLFSKCAIKVGSKRIFFFTNTDNPSEGELQAQTAAKRKAQDLADLGIEIELFSMNKPGEKFDLNRFYNQILSLDEEDVTDHYPVGADKLDQIMNQLNKKQYKKRTMARLPFQITENVQIAVRVFNLVGEAKKGVFTYMDPSAQNAEVKTLTKYVTNETGQIVGRKDLRSYVDFGGERIVFDQDELSKLKMVGEAGLMLMGFKPRSAIKRKHFLKAGPFIYPNDADIKNSSVVFNSLLESLMKKDKVAICRLIARSHTLPRFVALFPQKEEVDAEGIQTNPPGMFIVYLAYNDDIRKLAHPPLNKAKDDDIRNFQQIVKKLTLKGFVPVENPALQRHYSSLQLIALNQDIPENIIDKTLPNEEFLRQRAGPAITAFIQGAFPDGYDPVMKSGSSKPAAPKRKAATSKDKGDGDDDGDDGGGGGSSSRPKKAKAEVSADDVKNAVANGTVKKLTVAELKDFLKSVGVKTTSADKKDDLVRKAEDFYS